MAIDDVVLSNEFIDLQIRPINCIYGSSYVRFLEHTYTPHVDGAESLLILSRHQKIFERGLAEGKIFWKEYDLSASVSGLITRCFTASNGNHIIFHGPSDPVDLSIFGPRWDHIVSYTDSEFHPWHGSWSIDQSIFGTIIFAEYPYDFSADILNLWRSSDGGVTWDSCLSIAGLDMHTPNKSSSGSIRHFHTCQYYQDANLWIASTGDHHSNCRQFFSYDDGLSWVEKLVIGTSGQAISHPPRALRRTCELYGGDNHIYWVTDDRLGLNQSQFVAMNLENPGTLRLLGGVGANEARAIINLENKYYISISESKVKDQPASIYLMNKEMTPILIGDVNFGEKKTGFIYSKCSKKAENGFFYTFVGDGTFGGDVLTLEWEYKLKK